MFKPPQPGVNSLPQARDRPVRSKLASPPGFHPTGQSLQAKLVAKSAQHLVAQLRQAPEMPLGGQRQVPVPAPFCARAPHLSQSVQAKLAAKSAQHPIAQLRPAPGTPLGDQRQVPVPAPFSVRAPHLSLSMQAKLPAHSAQHPIAQLRPAPSTPPGAQRQVPVSAPFSVRVPDLIQRASESKVRPDSPRATAINNAAGSSYDSLNTVVTVQFSEPQGILGTHAVFTLGCTPDRSDQANIQGFETITYRDKADEHLHAEMLVIVEILKKKIDRSKITSFGVSRKACKYCGLVLTHEGFTVDINEDYVTKNWTNPYKRAGFATPALLADEIPK